MKKVVLIFISSLFICVLINAENRQEWIQEPGLGRWKIITSHNAPFPHPRRSGGLTYKGVFYSRENHFDSNRVLIFVPEGYNKEKNVRLVYYFHGWFGSIEDSLRRFDLLRTFADNLPRAIYVFPETARFAPDFFGGKLEEPGGFNRLNSEVLDLLAQENITGPGSAGQILLAGHSGAFRIISGILTHGGLQKPVAAVCLLDALYGRHEAFLSWLKKSSGTMLIVSTQAGGTRQSSEHFMESVQKAQFRYKKLTALPGAEDLFNNSRVVYVAEPVRGHEEVIGPYLALFLKVYAKRAR